MSQFLMQSSIERAQRYIDQNSDVVSTGRMRQRYHFMGPCGWINDPNGLIYYKNKYHFFFQFNPYSSFWGKMYWGHAISDDLLNWTYLPIALAPSEPYDDHEQGGCFSGSAIEKDGKLYLFYTGASNQGKGLVQTQNIAVSEDGVVFSKYEGNPVITAPEGVVQDCFRDPKVWEHQGTYYVVCGAQKENKAQALLYWSHDLLHWEFKNVLFESRGEWGNMWECPDFFEIDSNWVFICSPVGAGERKATYFIGDFDYQTGLFTPRTDGEMDWGLDFYAPQTFSDPNGRRIIVGWANGWQWMKYWKDWGPTFKEGWCGSFSIPREIQIREDGRLSFTPIRELEQLREDAVSIESLQLLPEKATEIHAGKGVSFELSFDIDLEHTSAATIDLFLRECNGEHISCKFDLVHAEMIIDRNNSDGWSTGISRSTLMPHAEKSIDITVLSDQSSVEIFVNHGTIVHSMNVFAPIEHNGIQIQAHGGTSLIKHVSGSGITKTC